MGGGKGTVTALAGEPLSEESGFPRTPSTKTFNSAQTPGGGGARPGGGPASSLREGVEANGFWGEPAFWKKAGSPHPSRLRFRLRQGYGGRESYGGQAGKNFQK